jgi:phospholipid-translocating ATPase
MLPMRNVEPLTVDNILWANTVLAAGSAIGFVVYTGTETRAVMNTSHPKTKVGLLDLEINQLAKVTSGTTPRNGAYDFYSDIMHCHFCVIRNPCCPEWL